MSGTAAPTEMCPHELTRMMPQKKGSLADCPFANQQDLEPLLMQTTDLAIVKNKG